MNRSRSLRGQMRYFSLRHRAHEREVGVSETSSASGWFRDHRRRPVRFGYGAGRSLRMAHRDRFGMRGQPAVRFGEESVAGQSSLRQVDCRSLREWTSADRFGEDCITLRQGHGADGSRRQGLVSGTRRLFGTRSFRRRIFGEAGEFSLRLRQARSSLRQGAPCSLREPLGSFV
jgi:hypothetical protein